MKTFLAFLFIILINDEIYALNLTKQKKINNRLIAKNEDIGRLALLKYDSQRNHPLLKHHFRQQFKEDEIKQVLNNLKNLINEHKKQIEQKQREEIYRKFLAEKIRSSIVNDFLTMRFF